METNRNANVGIVNSAIQTFNVGTKVQLRMQREVGVIEHFSSLIGFVKDEFLLVKAPVAQKTPFVFYDGEQILVRAFTGTTIYSFASTITRVILSPIYYMHLAYPQVIESSALRSALRVKVNLPATVSFDDPTGSNQSAQITLVNLSVSGASIDSEFAIAIGQHVQLDFLVHNDGAERAITTQAVARNVNFQKAGGSQKKDGFICGLEFQNISTADQTAIRLLTYETLLTGRENIA